MTPHGRGVERGTLASALVLPRARRVVSSLLIALALVLTSGQGCERRRHRPPRAPTVSAPPSPIFTPTSHVPLRYDGRVDRSDPDAPRFDWPASGFAFRFRGTGLSLRLRDVSFPDEIHDTDYLAVYVDDSAPITLPLVEGERDYAVISGLRDREHVVSIRKRTEAEVGTVTLFGVTLEPGGRFLEAPAAPARRILAIGDSITAGYGVDGTDARCHYSAGTENATRSYAFLAARELEASYEAIAWSGRGVYRNYDPTRPETVPVFYSRLLASEEGSTFDPRAFVPDVIVVNVGTNDLSAPKPDRARFLAAYRSLIGRVRADYPTSHIVLVVGPMLADDYPTPSSMALTKARRWVSSLVAERRAHGDSRISFLEVYGQGAVDGYGCDYHPSLTTQRKIAGALVSHIREQVGL